MTIVDASAAEEYTAVQLQLMLTERISQLEEQPLAGTGSRATKTTLPVAELCVQELKRELKRLNLKSTGSKEELFTRLHDRVGPSIEFELIFIEIDGKMERLTPDLQYGLLRAAKYREYTLLFPDGTKMSVAPCK